MRGTVNAAAGAITCARHRLPVQLISRDAVIRHADGGYCDSQEFAIANLDRAQVMILLITERGQQLMQGHSQ
jgi:hypothetical protein